VSFASGWGDERLQPGLPMEKSMQSNSGEWIEINELELKGRIGVPERERETPQRLVVSVRFQISATFQSLNDRIERTVDYALVAKEVEKVVGATGAHLIETLIAEIGEALMARFPMDRLRIELRKYILPNAAYVSVRLDKRKASSAAESQRAESQVRTRVD
jgi:7,8-dihydroneopterin aldolase/epimerase/oxygenase